MLETSRIWMTFGMVVLASCSITEAPRPAEAPTPAPAAPIVVAPAPTGPGEQERKAAQVKAAQLEEARSLLAQAETDVQRARAKRALWQKAWEELVASRQAVAAADSARGIRHARRASEFAQLGLEQLAYPAIK